MQKYTLVVVDMQSYFPAANDVPTIANVEREILQAIENQCDVVIVEIPYYSPRDDEGLPPTHSRLTTHLKNYSDHRKVYKPMFAHTPFQGAQNIISACQDLGFASSNFRVCGVRTGGWIRNEDGSVCNDERTDKPVHTGCVFDIVLGLSQLAPAAKIEVSQDACGDTAHTVNWDDFRELPNVDVLTPATPLVVGHRHLSGDATARPNLNIPHTFVDSIGYE